MDESSTTTTVRPASPLSGSHLGLLDSPSSYVRASKEDKAAIRAAYAEIMGGRLPKKKKKETQASAAITVAASENEAMPLKKGHLVRFVPEQLKSGRIQGGLARIVHVHFSSEVGAGTDNDGTDADAIGYDIEYVLGGKLCNVQRHELEYTTEELEGLLEKNRVRGKKKIYDEESLPQQVEKVHNKKPKLEQESEPSELMNALHQCNTEGGQLPKIEDNSKSSISGIKSNATTFTEESATIDSYDKKTSSKKKQTLIVENDTSRTSTTSESMKKKSISNSNISTNKSSSLRRPTSRRNSGNDCNENTDSNAAISSNNNGAASTEQRVVDMYNRHKKEMERSITRLQKVDRFGFFLDQPPPEYDEDYDNQDSDSCGRSTVDALKTLDGDHKRTSERKGQFRFPDCPPFNLIVLRKRFHAGRYDLDMVAMELVRRREIAAILKHSSVNLNEIKMNTTSVLENPTVDESPCSTKEYDKTVAETESQSTVEINAKINGDLEDRQISYEEVANSMYHKVGIDWETFNDDVTKMCKSALARDPDGLLLGPGHLGFAANKVMKVMEEMYNNYGCKRRFEMEQSEARHTFEKVLHGCGNKEAAMQGAWRKHAFPERKYERLESSSVICDGLSEMDKSYAIYELGTSIPDSFVGLAYTYDDSGQHSETWMKSVADETNLSAKSKSKRIKKESDDKVAMVEKERNKAHKAAMALANDDGVVRAQVYNTMMSLLIQVQDRVMTDLGVMHHPEARSANWDDGDHQRYYRGGAAEVAQGSKVTITANSASNKAALPEVAEQEVWGIDCYTRKNVMALIESRFTTEIAISFIEKWLLPAINACPVHLAHNMSTAARILEGLHPTSNDNELVEVSEPICGSHLKEKMIQGRKIPECSVFLRAALKSKIKQHGPPWLKAAARLIRLASDSLDEHDGFLRIHPKGHGSVVIGEQGLKANSLVTYYRGEVYPAWRWCEKLDAIELAQNKLGLRPNLPDFYNMAMERPKKDPRGYGILFVDASRKSGLGSSFSHSCSPTCEVRVVALNGKLSLSMTTLRDLEQGEELTFDYNAVTESLNEYRFAVCLCGHRNCRGSFLHFATADCYQQVLSRNSPIAARFANLVRGCMKRVMSRDDSELLLKHGFNTAAFGAVSFNHHINSNESIREKISSDVSNAAHTPTQEGKMLLQMEEGAPAMSYDRENDSERQRTLIQGTYKTGQESDVFSTSTKINLDFSPDSIENVPIWLRTYVADTLRYIEYERRALPVALLCNQMERMENEKIHQRKKNSQANPNRDLHIATESSSSEKSKSISGCKPQTSYFYFLQCNREKFSSIVHNEHRNELTGIGLSQAVNKEASRVWSNLSEDEKQSWKKKSIADWEKNCRKQKGKIEGESQRSTIVNEVKDIKKACSSIKTNTNEANKKKSQARNCDVKIEQKQISFADADAEGLSAMEQRIQQLAQSLSRVGRFLDRHRESVYNRKRIMSDVNSEFLRSLVPSPLKIMSDEEVVNWIWNDPNGVVHTLFKMVDLHFSKESLLNRLLSNTRDAYPVLSAFSQKQLDPSVEKKRGKNSCSCALARQLVRKALLEFRCDINDFLSLAEASYFDSIKQRHRDMERRRSKKKDVTTVTEGTATSTIMTEYSENDGTTLSHGVILAHIQESEISMPQQANDYDRKKSTQAGNIISDSSEVLDEALRIRGGGGNGLYPNSALQSSLQEQTTHTSINICPSGLVCQLLKPADTDVTHIHVIQKEQLLKTTSHDCVHPGETAPEMAIGDNGLAEAEDLPAVQAERRDCVITPSSTEFQEAENETGASVPPSMPKVSCQDEPSFVSCNVHVNEESVSNELENLSAPAFFTDVQEVHQSNLDGEYQNLLSEELPNGVLLNSASVTQSENGINHSNPSEVSPSLFNDFCTEQEKEMKQKKVNPLNQEQVTYLKNWLLDPKHILNPYPTEEEKSKIMQEINLERCYLDRWLQRHRKVVCYPVKPSVQKILKKKDIKHWENFRKQRFMLEATSDLVLMYAYTNTFFLIEPFHPFHSTPIEVYARELGNDVPRYLAVNNQRCIASILDRGVPDSETIRNDIIDDKSSPTDCQSPSVDLFSQKEHDVAFCSPDDVVTTVTVGYSGEYVVSQLLQWFNGGIGQKSGLPDIYGCIMLPSLSGCWNKIESKELKLSSYTRSNPLTVTEYKANVRPLLADWFNDRTQRGSPWNEELGRYFYPSCSSPNPLMPMGSPILDYLVTGIDENIQFVSSALKESESSERNGPSRSRSKTSASDRLQSTVDEGMPAQAVANWVQCEDPKCLKWRKLPWHVDIDLLPEKFFCKDNIWTPGSRSCDAPEDKWDMGDAPVKFDTVEDDFVVGVWFDVQREGKVGYHEAQVIETDFVSKVKRVKFHFWRLKNDCDEWVEVGSPRIAPHHSYTPRPLSGYGVPKKRKSGEKKCSSGDTLNDMFKRRKNEDVRSVDITSDSDIAKEMIATSDIKQENKEQEKAVLARTRKEGKFNLFPASTVSYLKTWLSLHSSNPFPTLQEKEIMIAETGLNKRQLSDWLAKARKKQRKIANDSQKNGLELGEQKVKNDDINHVSQMDSQEIVKAETPNDDSGHLENLLLQLKGALPIAQVSRYSNADTVSADAHNTLDLQCAVKDISRNDSTPEKNVENSNVKLNASLNTVPGPECKANHLGLSPQAKCYLWRWIREHSTNPFPTKTEKDNIMAEIGIEVNEIRKLEGWFSRARKKLKNEDQSKNNLPQWPSQGTSHIQILNDSISENTLGEQVKSLHVSNIETIDSNIDSKDTLGLITQPRLNIDLVMNAWIARSGNEFKFNLSNQDLEEIREEVGLNIQQIDHWLRQRKKNVLENVNFNASHTSLGCVVSDTVQPKLPAETKAILQNQQIQIQQDQIEREQNSSYTSHRTVSPSKNLSKINALLEAASIHSAARAKYSSGEPYQNVIVGLNDSHRPTKVNDSSFRPALHALSGSHNCLSKVVPQETLSQYPPSAMRTKETIVCQPIESSCMNEVTLHGPPPVPKSSISVHAVYHNLLHQRHSPNFSQDNCIHSSMGIVQCDKYPSRQEQRLEYSSKPYHPVIPGMYHNYYKEIQHPVTSEVRSGEIDSIHGSSNTCSHQNIHQRNPSGYHAPHMHKMQHNNVTHQKEWST